ncbi:hypothetical protein [Paenibacillus polymyxa]|uniref:Uncharacterized protein n=1 Tax=Paenibacillus polymyxa TaxID=1406 RepID=A0AAP4A4D8_PAEPO|nr:hypothetical protein [Paenibacillus polymyxa]MDH2332444.1 hypothetical protein [Paenibacillus polymyxa]
MNVQLTANYALRSDGTQFIVSQRKIVDPTKAPGYKAVEGGPAPELRERWDDVAYYPLTSGGLTSLLDSVRMRTVATSDASSLAEIGELLRQTTQELASAINAGLSPQFTVKLGA